MAEPVQLAIDDVGYLLDLRSIVLCRVKVLGYAELPAVVLNCPTRDVIERYTFEIIKVSSRRFMGANGEIYLPTKTIVRERPLGKESLDWMLSKDDLSDAWKCFSDEKKR